MMLRVSSTFEGREANLETVTQGGSADSGVPHQSALLSLVDATLKPELESALPKAREQLQSELSEAGLVDAAAVIGNFQRMTRIADGTGIPLDPPVAAITADLREELGINRFGSADNTPPVGWLKKTVAGWLAPLIIKRVTRQMRDQ